MTSGGELENLLSPQGNDVRHAKSRPNVVDSRSDQLSPLHVFEASASCDPSGRTVIESNNPTLEFRNESEHSMRKITRGGAVLFAAATVSTVLLPGSANAVSAGDKPDKVKVKYAKPPKPVLGDIVICNHSGYMFDVYAEGPDLRTDDLAGSFDECTDWDSVAPGSYDIGFSLRVPSQQNVIIQARFKRNGHVFYKVFKSEGIVQGKVAGDRVTRVDLFIPRG